MNGQRNASWLRYFLAFCAKSSFACVWEIVLRKLLSSSFSFWDETSVGTRPTQHIFLASIYCILLLLSYFQCTISTGGSRLVSLISRRWPRNGSGSAVSTRPADTIPRPAPAAIISSVMTHIPSPASKGHPGRETRARRPTLTVLWPPFSKIIVPRLLSSPRCPSVLHYASGLRSMSFVAVLQISARFQESRV